MSSDFRPPRPIPGNGSRSAPAAIRTDGLSKQYLTGRTGGMFRYRSLREELSGVFRRRRDGDREDRTIWALDDVSFRIGEGEAVGVIGRNGAGKSTLLKILSGITPPTSGRAEVRGRVGSLLEVGTGFHSELTGRENIFLSGAVLGMRRAEIRRKVDQIVEFSGVERYIDTPVKRYSSGMYLRLAFAVAAHLEPEILLVDEVLAVGDAEFQKKCLGRMAEIGATGRTVVFVSHSMPAILRLCDRVILLDGGKLVADGPSQEVIRTYLDSGLGTAAVREWPDVDQAPGDEVARLKAVRVRDDTGKVTEEIDITRPIDVEIDYWHLTRDPSLRPFANLIFFNEEGVCLFRSSDFVNREWADTPRRPGVVRARCRIPGNFLAEGRVYVLATVSTANPNVVHAVEHDAVAFQVVDRTSGEGVRGEFANEWLGVVRPMLDWTIEHQDTLAPRSGA